MSRFAVPLDSSFPVGVARLKGFIRESTKQDILDTLYSLLYCTVLLSNYIKSRSVRVFMHTCVRPSVSPSVSCTHYVLYCTFLYCSNMYTVVYWSCTILYCSLLFWTALYCTVLYCPATVNLMYWAILYWPGIGPWFWSLWCRVFHR